MPTENENQSAQVSGVPPPTACSKSECKTPRVEAWICSGKGWGSLIELARVIETERNIAVKSLEFISSRTSELQAGSMHNSARWALEEIQSLNPQVSRDGEKETT